MTSITNIKSNLLFIGLVQFTLLKSSFLIILIFLSKLRTLYPTPKYLIKLLFSEIIFFLIDVKSLVSPQPTSIIFLNLFSLNLIFFYK